MSGFRARGDSRGNRAYVQVASDYTTLVFRKDRYQDDRIALIFGHLPPTGVRSSIIELPVTHVEGKQAPRHIGFRSASRHR